MTMVFIYFIDLNEKLEGRRRKLFRGHNTKREADMERTNVRRMEKRMIAIKILIYIICYLLYSFTQFSQLPL